MVFDLKQLVKKYNMNINNVIHIGGHYGHEVKIYKEINPECFVEIFEPHPITFNIMKNNVSLFTNIKCHNIALGSKESKTTMFVENSNQGQSNSLLKPKQHTIQYPHIIFDETIEVDVKTLDSFNLNETYNFMSIDVQGYELEVLKGSHNTLNNIDYLIVEINNQELYENCCMVHQLDDFLSQFSLFRKETSWEGGTWGDGFYTKI